MKVCKTCKEEKQTSSFRRCLGTPDGLQYSCQDCIEKKRQKIIKKLPLEDDNERLKRKIKSNLLKAAKRRAKNKGLKFSITASDIELVEKCPVFCRPLVLGIGTFDDMSFSLDRKDNSKGYEPGNVRVISWKANDLKGEMSIEEVKRLLAYMEGKL